MSDSQENARAHWLARRRQGLGGSDAAALLGLSTYRTPLQLFYDKRGLLGDEPSTDRQQMGHDLEPIIARRLKLKKPELDVHYTDMESLLLSLDIPCEHFDYGPVGTLIVPHKEDDWRYATLDACVKNGRGFGVGEFKSLEVYAKGDWERALPDTALFQVMHNMAVLRSHRPDEFSFAVIAAQVGLGDFFCYEVEWDEDEARGLRVAEQAFWDAVIHDREPMPTGNAKEQQTISEVKGYEPGLVLDSDSYPIEEVLEIDQALFGLESNIKGIKAEIEKRRARLKQIMGAAEVLALPDGGRWVCKANKKGTRSLRRSG